MNIYKAHGCTGNCYKCPVKCSDAEEIEVQNTLIDGSFDRDYDAYGIAVDLGTTTIAAALVGIRRDNNTGEVIDSASCVNHQRRYGGDVISRIDKASDKFVASDMQMLVKRDISGLVKELSNKIRNSIDVICITGNTTMLHLLRGRDVSGLGKYPYTPVTLEYEVIAGAELGDDFSESTVVIFPGISAFVGGDIVAGLYALDVLSYPEKTSALVDLGTNGEIAFFDGKVIRVTSTAAGPVFEGGGISCGVPAIRGAIKHINIKDFFSELDIIGSVEPIGLCGTGVLEAVSELLRVGIIDYTGLLSDKYFEKGYPLTSSGDIRLTQNDIRNVQLAKAAIYSGLSNVINGKSVGTLFVSGGFGSHIRMDRIMNIKMFPEGISRNILSAGNTSLKGTIRYVVRHLTGNSEKALLDIKRICEVSQVVQLAELNQFDSEYIEAINF